MPIMEEDSICSARIKELSDYKFYDYLEQERYGRSFEEIEKVGEGGFGRVFKVKHRLD
jgi:hypothetical protein